MAAAADAASAQLQEAAFKRLYSEEYYDRWCGVASSSQQQPAVGRGVTRPLTASLAAAPASSRTRFMQDDVRPDGRGLSVCRPVSVAKHAVSSADGSAIAKVCASDLCSAPLRSAPATPSPLTHPPRHTPRHTTAHNSWARAPCWLACGWR
jgi:hypothetical protein